MAVIEVRTLLAGLSFILSLWLLVARTDDGRMHIADTEGGHSGEWRSQVGEKGSILPVEDETEGLFSVADDGNRMLSVEEKERIRISAEEEKSVEKGMQFLRNTGTEEEYRVVMLRTI